MVPIVSSRKLINNSARWLRTNKIILVLKINIHKLKNMRRIILDIDPWILSADRRLLIEGLGLFREQIASYRKMGFEVIAFSSAGMIDVDGELVETFGPLSPEIFELLSSVQGIWDKLVFGKPPRGLKGLVIDDKAVTPDEFIAHNYEQIKNLILEG